jgi:hypothetical protein
MKDEKAEKEREIPSKKLMREKGRKNIERESERKKT